MAGPSERAGASGALEPGWDRHADLLVWPIKYEEDGLCVDLSHEVCRRRYREFVAMFLIRSARSAGQIASAVASSSAIVHQRQAAMPSAACMASTPVISLRRLSVRAR